mmetsp:Transcript_3986/g.11119  ORF Transcript_3986/g.11119 Transcript_3986/m.11119 type:complete len:211 (+) Transcript_3986:506-1138(+)
MVVCHIVLDDGTPTLRHREIRFPYVFRGPQSLHLSAVKSIKERHCADRRVQHKRESRKTNPQGTQQDGTVHRRPVDLNVLGKTWLARSHVVHLCRFHEGRRESLLLPIIGESEGRLPQLCTWTSQRRVDGRSLRRLNLVPGTLVHGLVVSKKSRRRCHAKQGAVPDIHLASAAVLDGCLHHTQQDLQTRGVLCADELPQGGAHDRFLPQR